MSFVRTLAALHECALSIRRPTTTAAATVTVPGGDYSGRVNNGGGNGGGDGGQGFTLVPISAQPQLTLPLCAELKLTLSPT